ncbi:MULTISPECIES: hypothetical protein [Actinomadura]|uniref:hypothetical protein n=1 Tax=Actinomadura TaxID=1988 RepID=UPI0003ACFC1A|nr:hypothetical protein [Actinomadura madurae]
MRPPSAGVDTSVCEREDHEKNETGGAQFANDYLGESGFDATPINSIEIIKYAGGGTIEVC